MKIPQWLDDCVFYEIYPPSFYDADGDGIGDIAGMTAKLDYIKDSGFNAIWLNPWFDSPFRDGGYDIIDFFKVAPRYGSNEDAKRFFAEAHRRGLRVILDMVICHVAIEHPWFAESGKTEPNEYSDLFIWCPQLSYRGAKDEGNDYYVSGWSPRGAFKASFFAVQPAINYGFAKTRFPWEMPYHHPSCVKNRELAKDIMRFWLDLGCDGFRVDMAHSVIKRDPGLKMTGKFWREVRQMFDSEYPEAVLVSEWFNPKLSINSGFHIDFYNGMNFRNDDWMRLTPPTEKIVFAAHDHGDLKKWVHDYLDNYQSCGRKGYMGMFSGNHDVWRLAYYGQDRNINVKMALLLTVPGCPFVYYGDEIGMRYQSGLALEGGASRTGSRTPMQWDHSANLGFSKAAADRLYLPVDGAADAPTVSDALAGRNLVYTNTKKLLELRHRTPALQSRGKIEFVHGQNGKFPLVYRRTQGKQSVIVALNPTAENQRLPWRQTVKQILLADGATAADGKIELGPESFVIFAE